MRREQKLRVLMTVDAAGGVWHYALELAEGLAARDVSTVLAVVGPAPDDRQADSVRAIAGCKLVLTALPLEWMAHEPAAIESAGRRIARLAADLRVDLVHLNSPALAASAPFLCPVVAVCHSCLATWWIAVRGGPLPEDFGWRAALTGRGLSNADAVIVPTAAFGTALSNAYDLVPFPEVVWNGRTPAVAGDREDEPAPFVFTAGRLWDEGKNVDALDRTAERLTMPFLAAGPIAGPNRTRVAPHRLQLLGELSDQAVASHLQRRPIFVSLAHYEPFGLAALEAAQAGCALVLSDIPTFRELWDGAALFVHPDDDGAAAATVERIAADPRARDKLGIAAAGRAARYSPAAMTEGVLDIYRDLMRRGELLCEAAE